MHRRCPPSIWSTSAAALVDVDQIDNHLGIIDMAMTHSAECARAAALSYGAHKLEPPIMGANARSHAIPMKRKIHIPTDAEDAAITRAAQSDPDAPPLTDEQLARMRPARDVLAEVLGPEKADKLIKRPKNAG